MSNAEKALLIYNPCSGRNSCRPSSIEVLKRLEAGGVNADLLVTTHAGHARDAAATAAPEYGTIIVCGGDGTLNELISGLPEGVPSPRIGYVPTGSTNDLANNVGIPTTVNGSIDMICTGSTRGYDIGTFNDMKFTYISSFGPGVSVSFSTSQRFKNVFGHAAYMINGFVFRLVPTLKEVRPRHIKLEYDGVTVEDDYYFGAVSNTLNAAGLFTFDKNEVKFNDGKFEVVLIKKIASPLQFFSMLDKLHRHDYSDDAFLHFQASEMHFEFDRPEEWTVDGENSGPVTDVTIKANREAVQLICPHSINFTLE